MVSQFKENLFHLEGGRQRFDKDGCPDCIMRNANVGLGKEEDVIPKTRLEIVLHFREVKVRSRAALNELFCIVEEIESKVKQRTGHGFVVNGHPRFVEVPASGTVTQYS